MEKPELDQMLGEAVIVRICHDLASPAGAIANGIELLAMSPGDESFQQEATGLLRNSAQALSARLEFYRAAFGNAGAQALKLPGAKAVAEKYIAQLGDKNRIYQLDAFPSEPDQSAEWWRIALLLVLLAADSMPYGGKMRVKVKNGWPDLYTEGRKAVLPGEICENTLETSQIDPRLLAGVSLRRRAEQAGIVAVTEVLTDAFGIFFKESTCNTTIL